jgi:hypothetical protein
LHHCMFYLVGQKHNIDFSKTEQNNSSKLTILLAIIRLSRGLKNYTYLHAQCWGLFTWEEYERVSFWLLDPSECLGCNNVKNPYVLFLIFFSTPSFPLLLKKTPMLSLQHDCMYFKLSTMKLTSSKRFSFSIHIWPLQKKKPLLDG